MTTQEFSRYRAVVASQASEGLRAWPAPAPPVGALGWDIGLGVAGAALLLQDDPAQHHALAASLRRLAEPGAQPGMKPGAAGEALVDPAGHGRAVYLPLVMHLNLAAFRKRYENLPPAVWSVCEDALPGAMEAVRGAEHFADRPPPAERIHVTLWEALCLAEFGLAMSRDADLEYLDSVVHQIVSRAGAGRSLHARDERESLDAWTYRELAGLHALANLALLRRNRSWSQRVEEVAGYHLENTQPDNVTTQPWGVFAFLWSPRTRSFAEQQLHDAGTQATGGPSVAALLLADAAASLDAFGR